ncbi:MAG: MarR family EPS-associated transcriptional regulator [Candidatus Omnitrophota bacterium]
MNEHDTFNEETLYLIREIERDPSSSQRRLSNNLNISLGKTNYLIKELAKKGIVKIVSFSKSSGKVKKLQYVLTQKGLEEKVTLTYHFLKAREKEYKRLKEDYEKAIALVSTAQGQAAEKGHNT